jgi:hypothetical protein
MVVYQRTVIQDILYQPNNGILRRRHEQRGKGGKARSKKRKQNKPRPFIKFCGIAFHDLPLILFD